MNLELWKLIAAIGAVLITVVTGPIIWAVKAEVKNLRAEINQSELRLEKKMAEVETRLNERIDTRLVHR